MKRPYKLLVSGFGSIYIARLSAKPNIMSSDRFEVEESEFLHAIEQYLKSKSGSKTLEVKNQNGKVKMELKLVDNA